MDPYALGLTRRSSALIAAGISEWALRDEAWDKPFRGVARPAGISLERTDARVVDAVALMTSGCVLGGWASRNLQGTLYSDGIDRYGREEDVLITMGQDTQLRKRPGIRPSERRLHRNEVVDFAGVPVTTLARSAYDDMLDALNIAEAVVVAEMTVSRVTGGARTTLQSVQGIVDAHKKTRGIVQVRRALERVSERSGSPWETRLRIFAEDEAGISGWLINIPIFDHWGHLLGIADLLEPATGLVLESDGAGHRDEMQHSDDNLREEKFENAGLVVSRASAVDHRHPQRLTQRLCAAHTTAKVNNRPRLWTLDQPDWWHTWEPGSRYRTP